MNITFTVSPEMAFWVGYFVVAFLTSLLVCRYADWVDEAPLAQALLAVFWWLTLPAWILIIVFSTIPTKLVKKR